MDDLLHMIIRATNWSFWFSMPLYSLRSLVDFFYLSDFSKNDIYFHEIIDKSYQVLSFFFLFPAISRINVDIGSRFFVNLVIKNSRSVGL